MSRVRSRKGAAVLEFALGSVVLLPLFYGTIALGLNLGRSVEATQVSRDAASLYSRGTDFSQPGSQAMLRRLAAGVDLSSTGNGVIYLSQVMIVRAADCEAGGYDDGCPNEGSPVFLNRIAIGNTSLQASRFGTPSGMNAQGNIAGVYYLANANARGNSNLATMLANADVAQRQGEIAFLVEAWFDTPTLNPFGTITSAGVYANSIF